MEQGATPAGTTTTDGVETGTVTTDGVETYYERRGAGPAVVLVHAGVMSSTMWESQAEALADEFTVVTYDVRGHGRTGGSDAPVYSTALYAADLHALLDALGIERPVICGLSTGGCIAQTYAATCPDNVAGLVLADTFPARPLDLAGRLVFTNLRLFAALDRVVRYKRLNRLQIAVGERLSPGIAPEGATVQRLIDEDPTIPHREFAKIIRSMAAFPNSGLDLSPVRVPTLVMHGADVPAVLRRMSEQVVESLANAPVETTVVPGAGHASNVDNPAFFTATVRAFARGVFGGDGEARPRR